jgi:hypothetical protein
MRMSAVSCRTHLVNAEARHPLPFARDEHWGVGGGRRPFIQKLAA